ncbi:hypothetical protein SDJN02_27269, partial [Cucurbita argyrosperma subsp. argyrosperma]
MMEEYQVGVEGQVDLLIKVSTHPPVVPKVSSGAWICVHMPASSFSIDDSEPKQFRFLSASQKQPKEL